MKSVNIEIFDCIFAAGLLFVILSFLIKLLQKNNYEGLKEIKEPNTKLDNNPIQKTNDQPDNAINTLQYPKRKNMEPPPSLKNDVSKLDTSVDSNKLDTNNPSLTVIESTLPQQPAPLNIHLIN